MLDPNARLNTPGSKALVSFLFRIALERAQFCLSQTA